ncbi:MAG TPA: DUF1080 domain-containing protein [Verrucomicrobiae bacterium]|nr:DUF1080 domain-containing protein [Verrucomicrobiae bacterium]
MQHLHLRFIIGLILAGSLQCALAQGEEGFTSIFDGKSLAGWRISNENTNTWKIEDGALVTRGARSHLFYSGDQKPFRNFELKVEVMTDTNSNGGIYFHTQYQENGWPATGFECQVNVSHSDWKKTGSLYDVANLGHTPAKDNTWWTQHITVNGNKITVRIDGIVVLEYSEPAGAQAGRQFTRKLNEGTFGLQAHDPRSVVRYRNIRVKRLD